MTGIEAAVRGDAGARERVAAVLVGAPVVCLWCRGESNEPMEGIEGAGGLLTLTGFRRAEGHECAGPMATARGSLELSIDCALRRATEAMARLRDLPSLHWDLGGDDCTVVDR